MNHPDNIGPNRCSRESYEEHLSRYGYPRSVSYDVAGLAQPLPSGAAIARTIAKLSQVREPQYRPSVVKNSEIIPLNP